MEGKAGLHPGGRADGLRAPRAGGSNPSPLVCGAGVRVGGADPQLLRGGQRGLPQGQVWETLGPAEGSALHPGPDPTPWRSSPGPQTPPPGPSFPPQGQMFSWRRHRLGEGC